MKRTVTLFFILALALALLTSCELMAPGPTQRPSIGLPGGPSETDELTPSETADPTVDEYGFTIFPEGNYLADSKFDTEEYLPDYDADLSFVQPLATTLETLCRTQDTVFFLSDRKTGILGYLDKAAGISGPLCGKPECLHNGDSCNAYVGENTSGLCVYEGKLYWVSDSGVTRMNLDGTGRETVCSASDLHGGISVNSTCVLHRGYVYYAGSRHSVVVDGKAMSSVTVNAQPLSGGAGFTILDKVIDGQGANCLIKPVGNDLYIMLYHFNREEQEDSDAGRCSHTVEFYRWDSKLRQAKSLGGVQTEPGSMGIDVLSFYPVPGDGIYLGCNYHDTTNGFSERHGVVKYSFDAEELEDILWPPTDEEGRECSEPHFTRDYIVFAAGRALPNGEYDRLVLGYDYDGNRVFSGAYGQHSFSVFTGADDDFVYFLCDDPSCGPHFIAIPPDGRNMIVTG